MTHLKIACVTVWILSGFCLNVVFSNFCTKPENRPCGDYVCCCNKPNVYAICKYWKNQQSIPKLPSTIKNLVITENRLLHMSSETFINNYGMSLQKLELTHNKIETIHEDTFVHMKHLEKIFFNRDEQLNVSTLWRSFRYFDSLAILYLHQIGIYNLTDRSFSHLNKTYIRELDLSNNFLQHLNFTALKGFDSLELLNLHGNQLQTLSEPVSLKKLRVLYISGNRLELDPHFLCPKESTVSFFPKLRTLDVSKNLIRDLDQDAVSCLHMLQSLNLNGNRLQTIENNAFSELPMLAVLQVNNMELTLKTIQPNAFNSSSLQSLYMKSNNIQFHSIYKLNKSEVNIFDQCPNLTLLHVSSNNFGQLHKMVISRIFSPLKNLKEIQMIQANLIVIPSIFFTNSPFLSKMILDGNRIHIINGSSFNISSLTYLSLKFNRISDVREVDFPVNLRNSLKQINLRDNPFDCSCEMLWFRNWIDRNQNKPNNSGIKLEGWPERYTCKTPGSMNGKPLIRFLPTEEECTYHNHLTIFYIISGIVVLVTIIASLVTYKKRWYITYFFYKIKLGKRQKKLKNLEQCPLMRPNLERFDGYVIYSDEDNEFVHNDLIAIVEDKMKYKLHIWHRNASSGTKMEVMVEGIYTSDKVVAVISNNFIIDSWCQFQLTVALDRQVELKIENVLLIILDDVDLKSLSKYWCVIFTKIPSAFWCHTLGDIKRNVFEQKLIDHFRKHVEINE